MRKFVSRILTGVAIILLLGLFYVRFGFVDSRADIPVHRLEQAIAMPSLDASVARNAPDIRNPLNPSEANLISGMKIYQANCASCHGDVNHAKGPVADAFYPRAPQFVQDLPDMPENQNFYVVQHGIRLTGMPAWKRSLNDEQIWQGHNFYDPHG